MNRRRWNHTIFALLLIAATGSVGTFPAPALAARRKPVTLQIAIRRPTGGMMAAGEVHYRVVGRGLDSGWLPYPGKAASHRIVRRGWYRIYVAGGSKYRDQVVRRKVVDQPNRGNVFSVSIKMAYR